MRNVDIELWFFVCPSLWRPKPHLKLFCCSSTRDSRMVVSTRTKLEYARTVVVVCNDRKRTIGRSIPVLITLWPSSSSFWLPRAAQPWLQVYWLCPSIFSSRPGHGHMDGNTCRIWARWRTWTSASSKIEQKSLWIKGTCLFDFIDALSS